MNRMYDSAPILVDWRKWESMSRNWVDVCKWVMVNGCFDLLGPHHVAMLHDARDLGDGLLVALNSDRSVHELKGNGRPIRRVEERAILLAALRCVDAVLVFDEPTPLAVIEFVRPAILARCEPSSFTADERKVVQLCCSLRRHFFRSTSSLVNDIIGSDCK